MKAETLPPAVHQADLAQASGKGALHGSTDAGVAELVNALNALSVGVQEGAQGSGVQDKELAEVLVNLTSRSSLASPPTRPPSTLFRLGQGWRSRKSSQPLCCRIRRTS